MYKKTIGTLILSLFLFSALFAQEEVVYSSQDSATVSCSRINLEDKSYNDLAKKSFAAAEPYYLRSYNSKNDFAAFQLGKRQGSKVFLYIKLFKFNACMKDDKSLEIMTESGIRYSLENKLKVNCEGNIVAELSEKDIKELSGYKISGFLVMSLQKDYEFHLTQEMSSKFSEDLMCLSEYKF